MTRRKKGFWLFVFSLFPGAGEMYLGFFKLGISVMTLFLGTIALASYLSLGPIILVMPVIWFYSFFHVHNMASLSDEEFYSLQDEYLFVGKSNNDIRDLVSGEKGRKIIAVLCIIIGVCALWNIICDKVMDIFRFFGISSNIIYSFFHSVPQIVFALLIIWFGIYLIKGKKQKLEQLEEKKDVINSDIIDADKASE